MIKNSFSIQKIKHILHRGHYLDNFEILVFLILDSLPRQLIFQPTSVTK